MSTFLGAFGDITGYGKSDKIGMDLINHVVEGVKDIYTQKLENIMKTNRRLTEETIDTCFIDSLKEYN